MSNTKWLISCLLILLFYSSKSQSNLTLWRKLESIKQKPVDIFSHYLHYNGFHDTLIKENNVNPVISGSNVYAWINGSGRLYQMSDSTGWNQPKFQRIDSTVHTGNNFSSFTFNYNNRLYNLGGYGFWRRNGHLRIYVSDSKGWEIVPLNKEIPVIHSLVNQPLWYDPSEGKIYLCGFIELDDAISKKEVHNELMVLDLKTKTWSKIGNLSNDYLELIENGMKHSNNKYPITVVSIPWGIVVEIDPENVLLLDFKKNEILKMNETKYSQPAMLINKYSNHFYVDSMYFAYDPFSEKMDSMKLTYYDFTKTGKSIYNLNEKITYVLFGGFLLLISISSFLFYKRRKESNKLYPKQTQASQPLTEQNYTNHQFLKLEQTEKNILELLIINSKQNKHTTIDELNRILGVSGKNINIQKKQRSDMIISLNRKLSMIMMNEDDVILKIRNPYDKRSFDYYLDPEALNAITQLYFKLTS